MDRFKLREDLRRIIESSYEETTFTPEDAQKRGSKLMVFRPQLAINKLQKFIEEENQQMWKVN